MNQPSTASIETAEGLPAIAESRAAKAGAPKDKRKGLKLNAKQLEVLAVLRENPDATEILAVGGSRCVSGDTVIDGYTETIAELANKGKPIVVMTSEGPRIAAAPFYKGTDYLLVVRTESGKQIKVTDDHRFWDGTAWRKAKELTVGDSLAVRSSDASLPRSSWAFYLLASILGALRLIRTPQDLRVSCCKYPRQRGVQPPQGAASGQACRASSCGEAGRSRTRHFGCSPESDTRTPRQPVHEEVRSPADLWFLRRSGASIFQLGSKMGYRVVTRISGAFQRTRRCCPPRPEESLRNEAGAQSRRTCPAGLYDNHAEATHDSFASPKSAQVLENTRDVSLFRRLLRSLRKVFQQVSNHTRYQSDTPFVGGYSLDRIVSIEKTSTTEDYYTTTVPKNQQYFANGMLHHNSGKTYFCIHIIIVRALKYPESRHIICRLRFSHAKTSIWMDTLPAVLRAMGLKDGVHYKLNRSDFVVNFYNGAEIWIDGLDNADRVEKMLGREYNTIYYNEISQITYDTVTTVASRLAKYSYSDEYGECRNFSLFDCNPPSKRHWSYQLWFLHKDPLKNIPIPEERHRKYINFRLNPQDNIENLSKDYIEMLENLPEAKRKRFLLGEYGDVEGQIFTNWQVIPYVPNEVKEIAIRTLGVDFGFTVDPAAAVQCWFVKQRYGKSKLYIEEVAYSTGLTNPKLGKAIIDGLRSLPKRDMLARYGETEKLVPFDEFVEAERRKAVDARYIDGVGTPVIYAYADQSEPKSIAELNEYFNDKVPNIVTIGGLKGKDSVRAGIDWLQEVDIYITQGSLNVQAEFEAYEWEKDMEGRPTPEPIDTDNHTIDAVRYACSTHISRNTATLLPLGAS